MSRLDPSDPKRGSIRDRTDVGESAESPISGWREAIPIPRIPTVSSG